MIKYFKIFIVAFVFIAFCSCTIQRRTHRNGYYIDWHKKSNNTIVEKEAKKNNFIASADDKINLPEKEKLTFCLQASAACGDTLFLLNGTKTICKVIEISEAFVSYKRCDNMEGPIYSTSINEITEIKYNNGSTEYFNKSRKQESKTTAHSSCNDTLILKTGKIIYCEVLNEKGDYIKYKKCDSLNNSEFYIEKQKIKRIRKVSSNEIPESKIEDEKYTGQRETHPLSIASLISAIFTISFFISSLFVAQSILIVLSILLYLTAIILAIISIVEIMKNKEKYKGIGLSIFSIFLPALVVISLFALIVFLFGF